MNWQAILDSIVNWGMTAGLRLLVALILLLITFKIINVVANGLGKKAEKRGLDKTITRTIIYISKLAAKVAVAICLVGYVGIDTSGLAALITSFGVCIGLAVNGAVSNLAGGIVLILTRPFKLDDFIEACGYSGTVEEIRVTQTKLRTGDNKVVYLPNGSLSSSEIVNYSEKATRRVDFTFSIAYSNDFDQAKTIVMELMQAHELVLKDPAPMVRVTAHNASSVDLVARAWVNSGDYWTVNFDLLEQVKKAFDAAGIEIPFNQLDVHVKQD